MDWVYYVALFALLSADAAAQCAMCRTALEQNVDDVGFTRAIIESLQNEACIDAKRVYATGCSNGGGGGCFDL